MAVHPNMVRGWLARPRIAGSIPPRFVLMAAIALAASQVRAGPILVGSDIRISTGVYYIDEKFTEHPQSRQSFDGPFDDLIVAESLVRPRAWSRFPTSNYAPLHGFISGVMTSGGIGSAQLSGIQLFGQDALARSMYAQRLTNIGDEAAEVWIEYEIPFIDVSIWAPSSDDYSLPLINAQASAQYYLWHHRADGSLIYENRVFDYWAYISKTPFAGDDGSSYQTYRSEDLYNKLGEGARYVEGEVRGLRYPAFQGELWLASLEPGEYLEVTYTLEAIGFIGDRQEIGVQALIGDPSEARAAEPFRFRAGSAPATVPEPSTLVLSMVGLLALASRSQRFRDAVHHRLSAWRWLP